jgi:DeoR/GlpR family transcriptional regulator of sugar metabolism
MGQQTTSSEALAKRLSAVELESYVTVAEAARILSVSQDTVRRHYRHLFKQISVRRVGIKLRSLLDASEAA